ncbi:MAG: hypothetical protein AAB438_01385 [Patescibacteria group bacterium]
MDLDQRIAAVKKEIAIEKRKVAAAKRRLQVAEATGVPGKILMANQGLRIALQFCLDAEKKHRELLNEKIEFLEGKKKVLLKRLRS